MVLYYKSREKTCFRMHRLFLKYVHSVNLLFLTKKFSNGLVSVLMALTATEGPSDSIYQSTNKPYFLWLQNFEANK